MLNKTVCFTGHRNLPSGEISNIRETLKAVLVQLIEGGYCYFGAGGALGFDTVAALTVLQLKKKYPHIRLILVLPCKTQVRYWNDEDKAVHEDIKRRADKVVYTSEECHSGCMHKRNRHLVDNSGVCVCYLRERSGGTAYTADYAKTQGKTVINIAGLRIKKIDHMRILHIYYIRKNFLWNETLGFLYRSLKRA